METKSTRKTFLKAGLVLPAGLFPLNSVLEPIPFSQNLHRPQDTGKYWKYVIKEFYAKYRQQENVTVTPRALMADCIVTQQVFYKPKIKEK